MKNYLKTPHVSIKKALKDEDSISVSKYCTLDARSRT